MMARVIGLDARESPAVADPADPAAPAGRQGEPGGRSWRMLLAVAGIAGVATAVRWLPGAQDAFPVNDGGLFAVMAEEIRAAGYRLPEFTAYNGAEIPFAYPPLGLYVAALLSELPGVGLFDVLRIVPVAASVLTVVAFIPLAMRVLGSRHHALLAAAIFAVLPATYRWDVMGGGITRSLGFLFAVLALGVAWDVYERGHRGKAALAVVLVAAAYLSHLEAGMLATYGAGLFLLAHRERLRENLRLSVAGAAGVGVLTAPWWGAVVASHGIDPFLHAAGSSELPPSPFIILAPLDVSDSPFVDGFGFAALVGAAWSLRTRQFLLPAWYVLVFAIDPRQSPAFSTVPLAMLAARGFLDVLAPALQRPLRSPAVVDAAPGMPPWRSAGGAVIAYSLAGGVVAALLAAFYMTTIEASITQPLSAADRQAMAWVANETAEDAAFLVLVNNGGWAAASATEWFPALASRRSVATAQGTEWLPDGAYTRAIEDFQSLQGCVDEDAACLIEWAEETGKDFTHVYLAASTREIADADEPCCPALARSLENDAGFREIYHAGGVRIFERVAAGP